MPIPVTFSAAITTEEPSPEDSLRYAVALMLAADDVNRKRFSYDREDATKGVRILQSNPEVDALQKRIVAPQQVVMTALPNERWEPSTGGSGELNAFITVMVIRAPDTSYVPEDVSAPPITPEMELNRIKRILNRGTIYKADQPVTPYLIIDPYRTPRNEDGTYDEGALVSLTNQTPRIQVNAAQSFPFKYEATLKELLEFTPVRDFAVAYSLTAGWLIEVKDRTRMIGG